MRRLLDHDPFTGTSTWHDFDPVTDVTTIETVQDCEPYLEGNKNLYNDDDYKAGGMKRSWVHAARIPMGVIEHWRKFYGVDVFNKNHATAVKRLLSDPDWRSLRTANMKL